MMVLLLLDLLHVGLVVDNAAAAGTMADQWKADDERDPQSLFRRRVATTSVTATHPRPEHSQLDTVSPVLDTVERLVHDLAACHTVLVVRGPGPATEPHRPRRTASSQSTHGATQCPTGGPTS